MPLLPRTLTTPFSVHPGPNAAGLHGWIAALASSVLDPLLGLTALHRLYADLPHGDFVDRALERLGITVAAPDAELRHIPETGSAIVVANHPTGALDGLALAHAVMRRRRDVRLLGNHLLMRVPEMRSRVIAVNPFDPRSIDNRRGLRLARAWLARGGVLIVFPAGEVSNVHAAPGELVDAPWQRGVLGLAKWSDAAVVPAFIDARTSYWFKIAGWVHPRLRTALLPRELLRLRNRSIALRFAPPVAGTDLDSLPGPAAKLAYLRAKTYALQPRSSRDVARQPIAAAADPAALERDVAALEPEHALLRSGDCTVYCALAAQLPAILPEIGRLREITFRSAGEGTGRPRDLDRFDRYYEHLFVWHHARREIVGAYRVGATDRLCVRHGVKALYTHTLFALDPALLRDGPMLELGRSFVRAEYQRESNALLLLWKGIGTLVARAPRYRRLFGPVSISADYSAPARAMMARFLERRERSDLSGACSRRPFATEGWTAPLVHSRTDSLEAVDRLVKDLDGGPGVPVLVRQYWKLGAQVLATGIDPAFSDSLDALMLVDLSQLPDRLLQRYLGREGAVAFRKHH